MSSSDIDEPHSAPTLSAVAKLAGVSSITVSRVVRLPNLVAPETRTRVEAAMRELGYVPNQLPGALASGARTRAALLARRPEAIIMVGSPATEDGARLLRRAGIPIVETWEIPDSPIDAVAGFNNYEAGCAVARHLIAQGRQNLAFIGGDDPRAARRWNGFRDTTLNAGAREPRRLVLDRNASGCVVALANLPGVDAVFAANDAHAIGFMSGLRTAGLVRNGAAREQPVAVIGLGDLEMGRLVAPSLSSIRVHGDAIGRTAAKLMLTRDGPRRVDLGFELVLRDSG